MILYIYAERHLSSQFSEILGVDNDTSMRSNVKRSNGEFLEIIINRER